MDERTYSVISLAPICQLVQAIYDYQGENNDELNITKGDIITVTQTPDGGWFEGTLNGLTGWFPSNYVVPIDNVPNDSAKGRENGIESVVNGNGHRESAQQIPRLNPNHESRKQVIKDIMDNESSFIRELNSIHFHFLTLLAQSRSLPENDTQGVLDAVSHIITTHSQFLNGMQFAIDNRSSRSIRVGKVFMEFSGKMKQVHMHYCSLYPKFVSMVDKHKDIVTDILRSSSKFSSSHSGNQTPIAGASNETSPVVILNSSLSYPFRRLDKYPALLQELQRYTCESDPDRGDTQRALFLFRELGSCCSDVRRRKEMELEVLLGNIKELPDNFPDIETLGDIIRMSSVIVTQTPEDENVFLKDRYLVLFPKDLLLLSVVSNDMTSFTFEARLTLTDVTLPRISPTGDDVEKRSIDLLLARGIKYTFLCPSTEDYHSWMSLMLEAKRSCDSIYVRYSSAVQSLNPFVTTPQESNSTVSRQSTSTVSSTSSHPSRPRVSASPTTPATPVTFVRRRSGYWADKSLLPHPVTSYLDVLTSISDSNSSKKSLTKKKQMQGKRSTSPAADMAIFQTIESYCTNTATMSGTSARTPRKINTPMKTERSTGTMGSGSSPSSNRSIRDDDPLTTKFIMEEIQNLRKEMFSMRKEIEILNDELRKETEARIKLEKSISGHS